MQRIGIFGGTFNPPHKGHIYIAKEAKRLANLDRMIFIPCAQPPHKCVEGDISAEHRFNMTNAAVRDIPGFEISDIEINMGGKSYTAHTLEKLREIYPGDELCFVMGGDSLRDMEGWYRPERIFELARVVVIARDEMDRQRLLETAEIYEKKYGAQITIVDIPPMNVSSSEIRDILVQGGDASDMVPPSVLEYIEKNGIYKG